MNLKAAGEGYKVYSLCCANSFMIDFKFTSAVERVANLEPEEHSDSEEDFTQSETVILNLANSLLAHFPRPEPFYVLHLDNFFTTRRLYERLYKLGIRANGTAKAGSGIPKS